MPILKYTPPGEKYNLLAFFCLFVYFVPFPYGLDCFLLLPSVFIYGKQNIIKRFKLITSKTQQKLNAKVRKTIQ